jgi:hypothetical protein
MGVDVDDTRLNHTSYIIFVFIEFVQPSWGFDMVMVYFDL